MVKVKDISRFIDTLAPYNTQCEWDNCGILVGSEYKEIKKIGFCLDLTAETLNDAKEKGVDLIVTHHPVIFKAQKNFLEGNIAYDVALSGITVISAHTCFDCADGGVNDVLCEILGIENAVGVPSCECVLPMARIGNVNETDVVSFAKTVAKKLSTVCRVVNCNRKIKSVAVCGGAGMDFYLDAVKMGADCFITGDISHHQMLLAKETGVSVIAAGHFETEYLSMAALEKIIKSEFKETETYVLKQTNPVDFIG